MQSISGVWTHFSSWFHFQLEWPTCNMFWNYSFLLAKNTDYAIAISSIYLKFLSACWYKQCLVSFFDDEDRNDSLLAKLMVITVLVFKALLSDSNQSNMEKSLWCICTNLGTIILRLAYLWSNVVFKHLSLCYPLEDILLIWYSPVGWLLANWQAMSCGSSKGEIPTNHILNEIMDCEILDLSYFPLWT